jgi:nicotinamidase-related amidase
MSTGMARISRLKTTLDKDNTGLILFDALHGYLHPDDPKKQAFLAEHNILANLQRLLTAARRAGLTTFYPSGAHAPDGSDVVERLTDTDMELRPIGEKPIVPHIRKIPRMPRSRPSLRPRPAM